MEIEKRTPNISCAPYKLPESIVKTALETMDRAAPYGDTMALSTPVDPSDECWVAVIEDVGESSQRQLMAMQYDNNVWSRDAVLFLVDEHSGCDFS
ncbi:hypothetical protein V7S43_006459 [Phytophthora oleae]|uniref:Uncharacterized protein n=1 Tax=Phytophthora oleae TaxID=2107226 RepID=A0ABD3FN85_9STRA